MRRMSKSAVRVAREALAVGRAALPEYGSRYSRRDYTQPQLSTLLVPRQFLRTDYRGVVSLVADLASQTLHDRATPAALASPHGQTRPEQGAWTQRSRS